MPAHLLNHHRNHYANVNSLSTCHRQNYCKSFRLSLSFPFLPAMGTFPNGSNLTLKVEPRCSERDINRRTGYWHGRISHSPLTLTRKGDVACSHFGLCCGICASPFQLYNGMRWLASAISLILNINLYYTNLICQGLSLTLIIVPNSYININQINSYMPFNWAEVLLPYFFLMFDLFVLLFWQCKGTNFFRDMQIISVKKCKPLC